MSPRARGVLQSAPITWEAIRRLPTNITILIKKLHVKPAQPSWPARQGKKLHATAPLVYLTLTQSLPTHRRHPRPRHCHLRRPRPRPRRLPAAPHLAAPPPSRTWAMSPAARLLLMSLVLLPLPPPLLLLLPWLLPPLSPPFLVVSSNRWEINPPTASILPSGATGRRPPAARPGAAGETPPRRHPCTSPPGAAAEPTAALLPPPLPRRNRRSLDAGGHASSRRWNQPGSEMERPPERGGSGSGGDAKEGEGAVDSATDATRRW